MMRCSLINRSRQRGLATVETALAAPILMFFMIMMFQALKAAYLWEDRLIAARNAAWKAEIYKGGNASGPDLGQMAEFALDNIDGDLASLGEVKSLQDANVISFYKVETAEATDKFLGNARRNLTEANLPGWTDNLDKHKFSTTSGTSVSRYVPIHGEFRLGGPLVLSESHYADFAGGWENKDADMDKGYDSKLNAKLNPVEIYRDAFP